MNDSHNSSQRSTSRTPGLRGHRDARRRRGLGRSRSCRRSRNASNPARAPCRLPGIASGTVTANPCAGCPSLRLRLDAKTRFFIGKDQVAYARFREAAAKGDLRLDLYYEPKSRTLNRVRLATASAAK